MKVADLNPGQLSARDALLRAAAKMLSAGCKAVLLEGRLQVQDDACMNAPIAEFTAAVDAVLSACASSTHAVVGLEALTEAVVREKARLHVQAGHSWRGFWSEGTEMCFQLIELGFKAGFRDAERAHGIGMAPEGAAAVGDDRGLDARA